MALVSSTAPTAAKVSVNGSSTVDASARLPASIPMFAARAAMNSASELAAMTAEMPTASAAARSRTTRLREMGVLSTVSRRPWLSSEDQRETLVIANAASTISKMPNQK